MAGNLPSPSATPPPQSHDDVNKTDNHSNIHDLYIKYLKTSDSPLPPHLAAVSAITKALTDSTAQLPTLSETLAHLTTLTTELKSSLPPATALAISAGTDAFQRQLITALAASSNNPQNPDQSQSQDSSSNDKVLESDQDDPERTTRATIQKASHSFLAHQLNLRARITPYGRRFIRPGSTVVVPSSRSSRLVDDFLLDAAEGDVPFRVIFVEGSSSSSSPSPSSSSAAPTDSFKDTTSTRASTLGSLHARKIPTTTISPLSLPSILSPSPTSSTKTPLAPCPLQRHLYPPQQTLILLGAAALLGNGGVLASREGSVAAWIARGCGREIWVLAEGCVCVRGMGVGGGGGAAGGGEELVWEGGEEEKDDDDNQQPQDSSQKIKRDGRNADMLDVIPAHLITGYITEEGPRNGAAAVVEEAMRLWL